MLYTDGIHLISDTGIENLHQYALSVGISRNSFIITGAIANHPHYRIYGNTRRRILADCQVIQTTPRHLVKLLQLNYNFPRTEEEVREWEAQYGKLNMKDFEVSERITNKIIASLTANNTCN